MVFGDPRKRVQEEGEVILLPSLPAPNNKCLMGTARETKILLHLHTQKEVGWISKRERNTKEAEKVAGTDGSVGGQVCIFMDQIHPGPHPAPRCQKNEDRKVLRPCELFSSWSGGEMLHYSSRGSL